VYDFIYPLDDAAKSNLAYYFTFEYADGQDPATYTRRFLEAIRQWQTGQDSYHFLYTLTGENLVLWDFRDLGDEPLVVLPPLEKDIYLACDVACTVDDLCLQLAYETDEQRVEVDMALERMVKRKLMVRGGNRYLSLATELDEATVSVHALIAMQKYVEANRKTGSTSDESVIDLREFVLA
jgi:hypothetical protein